MLIGCLNISSSSVLSFIFLKDVDMSSQTSSRTNIILLQIKLIFGISDSFNFKSDDIKDGKNERDKEALFESKTFLNALFPILYDSIDLWTSVFSLSFFCSSLSKFVFKLCWDIISKFEINNFIFISIVVSV